MTAQGLNNYIDDKALWLIAFLEHLSAENCCGFALHLCLCVIMADATELSGVGGGYVEQ